MPPATKKTPEPSPASAPAKELVKLHYHGEGERRLHDPRTGQEYVFQAGKSTRVPDDLARGLHASDKALFTLEA